jgi:hypothetical protein
MCVATGQEPTVRFLYLVCAFVLSIGLTAPARTQPIPQPAKEGNAATGGEQNQSGGGQQKDSALQQAPNSPVAAKAQTDTAEQKSGENSGPSINETGSDSLTNTLQLIFSGILVFVGVAQATAAFLQWKVYGRQEFIMEQQREIMNRQVDLSLNTQRAFIFMDNINYFKGTHENGEQIRIIDIDWRNKGATPAINTEIYTEFKILPGSDGKDPPHFVVRPNVIISTASVGPGILVHSRFQAILERDLIASFTGEKDIFIYVRCNYNDIFQGTPRRHVESCMYVEVIADPATNKEPLRFAVIGPQNSSS